MPERAVIAVGKQSRAYGTGAAEIDLPFAFADLPAGVTCQRLA